ncbi:MAG: hypothetical protein DME95_00575 [Verrucomicrobia bacterium]|nr:MAG: hypothetical protein DME95_00575 [Verrucomicrobiota bacterium]
MLSGKNFYRVWVAEHTRLVRHRTDSSAGETDSPWRTCGSLRLATTNVRFREVREGGTPSPAPETGALPRMIVARQTNFTVEAVRPPDLSGRLWV